MDTSNTAIKNKATLIYSVVILLGLSLSALVYQSTQQVEHSTLTLVDEEISIYKRLQELDAAFTEQERYLYEYYATQARGLYQDMFLTTAAKTTELLTDLKNAKVADNQIIALHDIQTDIQNLAEIFDQNMYKARTGAEWDLAREQLEQLSTYRSKVVPIVNEIAEQAQQRVDQQYLDTRQNLQQTSFTVIAYSLLIIAMALIIGRYISKFVMVSALSKRLSLFPRRNPNPIISLNAENQVTYANPATDKLLTDIGISESDFYQRLTECTRIYQDEINKTNSSHIKYEMLIGAKTLECELHALRDINGWDLHVVDITLRKQAEDKVSYQAYHELHTGLFNKNKLYEVLENFTEQNKSFVMGAIEIRMYNQLVARLGLEITGKIVRELAETLNDIFAETVLDTGYMLFQTSDKDFALIIEDLVDEIALGNLVRMIESELEQHCFTNEQRIELDFGFCCVPKHANDKNAIIKCVNMALEKALSVDHHSYVIYSTELGNALEKELILTEKLERAIIDGDLELHFQPQLDIQEEKIIGVETLIRWFAPDGFIPPSEFIPIAEKSGLIVPLGNWIMLNACKKAKQLVDLGYSDLVVAINISPQQFQHPDFEEMLKSALSESGVPAQNIELEITEGVVMHNEQDVIAALQRLKETGVMLSIDDFGTGYSSLSYLKQFPIDKLKIDQSFVKQLQEDADDKAIVRTVIDLGSHLQLKLIAEGVEIKEQLELLKLMGCHEIQGYYFSKPLSSSDLNEFLAKHIAAEIEIA